MKRTDRSLRLWNEGMAGTPDWLLRPHPFERIHRDLTLYLRQPAPDATLVDIGKFVLNAAQPSHQIWE